MSHISPHFELNKTLLSWRFIHMLSVCAFFQEHHTENLDSEQVSRFTLNYTLKICCYSDLLPPITFFGSPNVNVKPL